MSLKDFQVNVGDGSTINCQVSSRFSEKAGLAGASSSEYYVVPLVDCTAKRSPGWLNETLYPLL